VNRLLNYLSDQAWASVLEGRGHADALENIRMLKRWAVLGGVGILFAVLCTFLADGVLTTFQENPYLSGLGAERLRPYFGVVLGLAMALAGCIALWNMAILGLLARRMEGD
jgi:hypothetical protein